MQLSALVLVTKSVNMQSVPPLFPGKSLLDMADPDYY